MDPDPGGPKTCGYGSGTLPEAMLCHAPNPRHSQQNQKEKKEIIKNSWSFITPNCGQKQAIEIKEKVNLEKAPRIFDLTIICNLKK
jgi:hypothetical protein